jgi:hypothetical protein
MARLYKNFKTGIPFIHFLATNSLSFPSFFKNSVANFMTAGFRQIVSYIQFGKCRATDTVLIHGDQSIYLDRMIYKKNQKVEIL